PNQAVVSIMRAPVGIHGVTVHGAAGTSSAHGIYCVAGGGPVTLTDAAVADNAGSGLIACTVTMQDTIVSGNGDAGISGNVALDVEASIIKGSKGLGIRTSGGSLKLARAVVASNAGGGIQLQLPTSFLLENSFITQNGTATSAIGGLSLEYAQSGTKGTIH